MSIPPSPSNSAPKGDVPRVLSIFKRRRRLWARSITRRCSSGFTTCESQVLVAIGLYSPCTLYTGGRVVSVTMELSLRISCVKPLVECRPAHNIPAEGPIPGLIQDLSVLLEGSST